MVPKAYDDSVTVQVEGTGIWLPLSEYHMGYQQHKKMTVTIAFESTFIADPVLFIPKPGRSIVVRFLGPQNCSFVQGKAHNVHFNWVIPTQPELQFDIVSLEDIVKDHERWFPLMVEEAARMKRLGIS